MQLKTQWSLVFVMLMVPYVLLGGAGITWLLEREYFLAWVGVTALVSVAGWPLVRRLKRLSAGTVTQVKVDPSGNWPPAGREAWRQIELIAGRPEIVDVPIDRAEPLWELFQEVLLAAARQYHPRSAKPLLEIPVPHLLRVVELVCHDLREAFSEKIPGSHILTINDLMRLKRLATLAPSLYRLYRVIGLVISPVTGLARELNLYMQNRVVNESAQETKRWILQFAVKKAGFYAIELYSGNLVLTDVEIKSFTAPTTRASLGREQARDAAVQEEPLRILVLGQVKAGKSSLVNALFGEVKAAVDVVPRTRHVEPYLLERDGLRRAIILDTAGYEDAAHAASTLEEARSELLQCDLILLTCSAQSAARDADRRLLNGVRELFQHDPDREFPPLVVALTHIDQLRPVREWTPPYDIAQPQGMKAEQIRQAMEVTAADLQVDLSRVVPVCLRPEQIYNVEEGLIPAILSLMDAAHRLRYLRCLREFKDEEYWSRLRQQAGATGRVLLKAGFHLLGEAGRKLDSFTSNFPGKNEK